MKKVVLFFVCVLALFTACKKDEPVSDKIEEIKFDSEMYEVFEYDTLDLRSKLQILPAIVGDTAAITWKSDDERLVKVSKEGVVSALSQGIVVITATAQDKTAKCSLKVERNIENVFFRQEEYVFPRISRVNLYHELIIIYNKETETKPEIRWYSENRSVADVREDGWLEIYSPGVVEIVVEVAGMHTHCFIEITEEVPEGAVVPISFMEISERLLSYCIGGVAELFLIIEPYDASYKDIEWKSSDENVVTVDENGVVSFVGAGEGFVYAIHKAKYPGDRDAQAEAKVIVGDCQY